MKRAALALSAVAGFFSFAPAAAWGHAQLLSTAPVEGATVKKEPSEVIFRFDQPVEGNFGAVRAYNSAGARVDQGDAFHPNSAGSAMAVHLRPGLPQGSYTATYRVVSADGHIVSSGFVFSIGHPSRTRQTVGQLISASGSGPVTDVVYGVAKALQYMAIALGVGGIVFLLAIWLPALRATSGADRSWLEASQAFMRRMRTVLIAAAVIGAFSAALAIVMEGAEAAGVSGFSALTERIIRETLGTRFGTFWGLGVCAWLLVGAVGVFLLAPARQAKMALRPASLGATGLAMPRFGGRLALGLLIAPLAYVLLLPVVSGHASTQHPSALLLPTNLLHVAAMSVWLGGLASLLFVLPVATRRVAEGDRSRLLAAALARFSPLALAAVLVIVATGLIQAYVYVRHLDLLTTTPFGRAVLIKIGLLIVLIGFGAYQRRKSIPRLERIAADARPPGRAGLLLRRALRAEVALIVVVLGVTAALTSYAPAIQASTGPVSTTTTIGPLELEMFLDPARVGSNQIHLYFLNRKTGAQFTGAKEVDVTATETGKSIGPLTEKPQKSGPGHYTVLGALLNVPGTWAIQVTVRVSAFDEYTKTIQVPIR